MKKLLIPLMATAALAAPTSALARTGHHRGGGEHHGTFVRLAAKAKHNHIAAIAGIAKLSGTGTSFGVASASISGTTFTATLATTWSSATTKSVGGGGVSCAPATASITLTTGTTTTTSYTGKTCSWTRNGTTTYAFYGSASNGYRAFLTENGTTVTGAISMGGAKMHMGANEGLHLGVFVGLHKGAAAGSMHGNCDHH